MTDRNENDALNDLAARAGILPAYHDFSGDEHFTTPETRDALLAAMGLPNTHKEAIELLAAWDGLAATRTLPTDMVLEADVPHRLEPTGGDRSWEIEFENGEVITGTGEDGINLPPLPYGYHRLWRGHEQTLLIVAPSRAPSVEDRVGTSRIWGATTSLYGMTSARNGGIGDYEDLAQTAEAMASLGADFLGVNPVHALGAHSSNISPYSPSHRGLFNTRHIAVDHAPEFQNSDAAKRLWHDAGDALKALRKAEYVDYRGADIIAMRALRACFDTFEETGEQTGRRDAFDAFRYAGGAGLETFAVFESLTQAYGPDPAIWPSELRAPDTDEVRMFADAYAREVRFYIYLQWLADGQLGSAHGRAKAAGMGLGLYADLAVGVRADGAEPWARPDAFSVGASLGVPPDQFNAQGQSWGLVPINPHTLREMAYRPMIETMRQTMRHAGLLRIDHAIGLMRCFWIPATGEPGAYVRYPMAEILAIIRIEATRSGCVVVGEDLGVVPEGLRDTLSVNRLYGCAVMQFEREHDSAFRHPHNYRGDTLASFGTHDTPTLPGYWLGCDIEKRIELGQFSEDDASHARQERADARTRLLWMLKDTHVLPDGIDPTTPPEEFSVPLRVAMHAALAETKAEMVAVQLDDALGSPLQPNFPGTVDTYPNWRIKTPYRVEKIAIQKPFVEIAAVMQNAGRGTDAQQRRKQA